MLAIQGACVRFEPKSSQPFCQALKSLNEVLAWKPSKDQLFFSTATHTKKFQRPLEKRKKPYTLVCHDFKGGYLEDRYLQGGIKNNAYYFCRWECIDIFIYFSHQFVTIPPIGWIRAAHKHNSMILGTIITEWEDGASLWSSLLSSRERMETFVHSLVAICRHHDFDGWLVNVENKIEEKQVPGLKDFVELLTNESHRVIPGSRVLWYDSVTRKGELKWQDQLNEENSMFFDACDGIFLNYCWTPEKLAASKQLAVEKNRPFDVFVGIDVFGRGCKGGGGFNTREALQCAREQNLSAAIFAPGWVLETLGVADFDATDCRFWAKLHDLCALSTVTEIPLSSAFCQGHGDAFFVDGEDRTGRQWYNMSLQQRQPQRTRVYGFSDPSTQPSQPSLNTCLSSAYLGGCSIELSAHLTRPLQTVTFRLFDVKAVLDETLFCSVTFKHGRGVPCDLYLVLTFGAGLLTKRAIMGLQHQQPQHLHRELSSSLGEFDGLTAESKRPRTEDGAVYVQPLTPEQLKPYQSSLWFHNAQQKNAHGWTTWHFRCDATALVSSPSSSGQEAISVSVSMSHPPRPGTLGCDQEPTVRELHKDVKRTSVLLGHLQVFREQDLKLEAPKVTGIKLEKMDSLFEDLDLTTLAGQPDQSPEAGGGSEEAEEGGGLAALLANPSYLVDWQVEGAAAVDYFNVYLREGGRPRLMGHTPTNSYVTSIAAKFVQDGKVTVSIQPVLAATGLPPALSHCATETLTLDTRAE